MPTAAAMHQAACLSPAQPPPSHSHRRLHSRTSKSTHPHATHPRTGTDAAAHGEAASATHAASAAAAPAAAASAADPAPGTDGPAAPDAALSAPPHFKVIPDGVPVMEVATLAYVTAPAAPRTAPGPDLTAMAAAAAATGLPPPPAAIQSPPEPSPTPAAPSSATGSAKSSTGATSESSKAGQPKKVALSQSPPAGFRLPFPPSHLLWMADGTQSSIADLFLTPPAATPAAATPAPAATTATAASTTADAGATSSPTAAAASASDAAASASPAPATPPPRPRVVLVVGFVGAFLSLCQQQLPPYSSRWPEFRRRGVDSILAVSVNDHAVLKSFAQQAELDLSRVGLIADHDGSFCRGLNLALDLSAAGMGLRARRFAMIVREGVVQDCFVEDNPGELTVSSADAMLQHLPIVPEPEQATKGKKKKNSEANGSATGTGAAAGSGGAASSADGGSNGSSSSAAAKVVAAVQRTVAAVSDRFDSTTDAKEKETAAAAPDAQQEAAAPAAPAQPMTEQEREEAAQKAAADIPPPGQA